MKTKIEKALGEITQQMNLLNNSIVRFIKEQPNSKIVINFLDEGNVYDCIEAARQVKIDYENGTSSIKPDTWDVIFSSLYVSDCVLDIGLYVGERLVRSYFIVGYRSTCPTIDGYWTPEELYFIDWAEDNKIKRMRKYEYPLSDDAYKFVSIAMLGWANMFMRIYLCEPNVNDKLYDFRAKLFKEGDKVSYGLEYCRLIG